MAKYQSKTKEKLQNNKNDDAPVYRVMIALAVAIACLVGLRSLRSYYATMEGFSALYDHANTIALCGLVLAAVAALVGFFVKVRAVRTVAPWVFTIALLTAITGRSMFISGIQDFSFLYFLCAACLIQYIIFQLYRWEFFLFSLSAITAGGVFFSFSRGLYWTGKNITLMVILALVLVGTTLLCRKASADKGWIRFRGSRVRILNPKSTPTIIYIANILWLICAAGIPVLGGLFAYYCMFAAIAVEFIAAVYYTFQLT